MVAAELADQGTGADPPRWRLLLPKLLPGAGLGDLESDVSAGQVLSRLSESNR